jgi:hypothetical protein
MHTHFWLRQSAAVSGKTETKTETKIKIKR